MPADEVHMFLNLLELKLWKQKQMNSTKTSPCFFININASIFFQKSTHVSTDSIWTQIGNLSKHIRRSEGRIYRIWNNIAANERF